MVEFENLQKKRLKDMEKAGAQVLECYRVLQKTGDNLVGEVLRGQGEFYEWDHYPAGDVYDFETHSQYYYHAHPPEDRANKWGAEHGHFHTFLRPKGMPRGVKPAAVADYEPPDDPNDDLTHFIAISMNQAGYPIRLFSTNRWVTGESWYDAGDVIRLLDHFHIDHAQPSWPVNIWITNLLRLFHPQIEDLLSRRDEAVADWQKRHPGENAFEDRKLEITAITDISVEAQIKAVQKALKAS